MVALFVAIMFVAFILADAIVQKIEARKLEQPANLVLARGELAEWVTVPTGIQIHAGHSWTMPLQEGTVRAGIDSLVAKAVGSLSRVYLPETGEWIDKGQALARLEFNGRTLSIVAPVSGRISAVNRSLMNEPDAVVQDPYGAGWICSMQEAKPKEHTSYTGKRATLWLQHELERFREFLSVRMTPEFAAAVTSQDGGVPVSGALAQFKPEACAAFEQEFIRQS